MCEDRRVSYLIIRIDVQNAKKSKMDISVESGDDRSKAYCFKWFNSVDVLRHKDNVIQWGREYRSPVLIHDIPSPFIRFLLRNTFPINSVVKN